VIILLSVVIVVYFLCIFTDILIILTYVWRAGDKLDRRPRILFSRVCTQCGRAKRTTSRA